MASRLKTFHEYRKRMNTDEEFFEAFNVALVVGGSIVITHLRRAVESLEEIRKEEVD